MTGTAITFAWKLLREHGIPGIEPLELVANLSLGQRQIVEIVKVISRNPQVLFMDEPTSALAEREVEWLFGVIRKLRTQGTCIVFTSHRWNEIKGIADRITIFRNGENVGTYEATDLNEQDTVERMTGRKLNMLYITQTLMGVAPSASAVRRLNQTLTEQFEECRERPLLTHYLLDTVETVVKFAQTMSWKGKPPVVRLLTTLSYTGVRLTKQAMAEVETHVQRLIGLERWFVDISCATSASSDTSFFLTPQIYHCVLRGIAASDSER